MYFIYFYFFKKNYKKKKKKKKKINIYSIIECQFRIKDKKSGLVQKKRVKRVIFKFETKIQNYKNRILQKVKYKIYKGQKLKKKRVNPLSCFIQI